MVELNDKQKLALYKKSQSSGYSIAVLEEIYLRGYSLWNESFTGNPEQFGFDRVNSFIAGGYATELDADLLEGKRGLWDNIHAKRARIKAGSGERMRKPGSKGAPTDAAIKASQNEEADPCWDGYKQVGVKKKGGKKVPNCVPEAFETSEKQSKNPNDPSSRFDGTTSATNVYAGETPGQAKRDKPKKNKALKVIRKVIKENMTKTYVDPKTQTQTRNEKPKLNTLDYDLANFPLAPFSSDEYQKGVDKSIRPYAAYTWGFGTKPASSQQELDWEQANREKQEIRKQKTSLPGTVDVERTAKGDRQRNKNETIVPKNNPPNKKNNFVVSMGEATYQGKTVPLNKPMKGDVKKSKVYVDPDGDGKAQKVNFGSKTMSIKKHIKSNKDSYCARSKPLGNDPTKANYWSRRAWDC